MKAVTTCSIRLWMPLLVFSISGLVWMMVTWHEYNHLKHSIFTFAERFIAQDMASLQHVLENDLSLGQDTEAERALVYRGVNNQYRTLVATDDQGVILYSTRFSLKGLQAINTLSDFEASRFSDIQEYDHVDLRVIPEDNKIIAYFPLTLERDSNEIRALRTGVIFLVYDFSSDLSQVWHELWHKSEVIASVFILFMLTLFLALHRYFYCPVQHLVAKTRAFAKGDYNVRSTINGRGELADLGEAFNNMAVQLNERSRENELAERDLQASEKLYRTLIEATSAVAWEYSIELKKFTFMSANIYQLTGYPAELWTSYEYWESRVSG